MTISDDGKKIFSPVYITLGLDLNYYFTPNVFIRPNIAFIGGVDVGHTF